MPRLELKLVHSTPSEDPRLTGHQIIEAALEREAEARRAGPAETPTIMCHWELSSLQGTRMARAWTARRR